MERHITASHRQPPVVVQPLFWVLLLLSYFYTACDGKRDETVAQNDPTAYRIIESGDSAKTSSMSSVAVRRRPTGKRAVAFTTANGFEWVTAGQNCSIERTKEGLLIHGLTNDPALSLPTLKVRPGSILLVQIQIVAPLQTNLQVFYNTASAHEFSEANSVRKLLYKGDNYVTVEITDPAFAGDIRFDPGELPCDYTLKLLEVIAEDEEQSPVGPSPTAPTVP